MSITSVQTAVAANAVIGAPGQSYDAEPKTVVSRIAEEDIPFGVWVSFTTEEKCELPDSAGEITAITAGGIAMRDPNRASTEGYKTGDLVRVCTRGKIFVLAEETVVIGDTPFARHTSGGGGSQKGAFRNDADTASAATPANTKFYRGGGTAQPPVLELF